MISVSQGDYHVLSERQRAFMAPRLLRSRNGPSFWVQEDHSWTSRRRCAQISASPDRSASFCTPHWPARTRHRRQVQHHSRMIEEMMATTMSGVRPTRCETFSLSAREISACTVRGEIGPSCTAPQDTGGLSQSVPIGYRLPKKKFSAIRRQRSRSRIVLSPGRGRSLHGEEAPIGFRSAGLFEGAGQSISARSARSTPDVAEGRRLLFLVASPFAVCFLQIR